MKFSVSTPLLASVAAGLILYLPAVLHAQLTLTTTPGTDDFILATNSQTIAIVSEPTEDRAVTRAIGDLATDIARVTGDKPALTMAPNGTNHLVIIGTLGRSRTIDQLAAKGKLDVTGVRGRWESYALQIVKNPLPGVDTALVIAGSDRRGTIYGIYHLSETLGVSPWHWWADVPIRTNKSLALHGALKQGPPAVKYRGIFLNNEEWGLRPWAAKTFDTNTANIGPKTYEKVFELLLRLRANCLWPAMHPGTRAFNYYPTNKELAEAYGIVMGSSPCEPMLCNNMNEWDTNKLGEYNYVSNRQRVLVYWEERVKKNGKFENIYTVGMCGIHDSGMPGGGTPKEKALRLHHIIADQRKLLARHVNSNVAAVPQIFVPEREALELYHLAPDLPKDITLVWPDDGYGYIRQFSNESERKRSGGAGVFYHLSYLGQPADYLWLCSTPPALMAEELTKAYTHGADRVWIVDVGDIKPAEVATEFFLKLAWNPYIWNGTNVNELLAQQFARDFNPTNAHEIAAIMDEYYRLNFQRKPEHVAIDTNNVELAKPTFSMTLNGDEADGRLRAWQALARRLGVLEKQLPPEVEDACFELVGYPIYASAVANERAYALSRFQAHLQQSRATVVDHRSWAQLANTSITAMTDAYNTRTASNKWRYILSDHPNGKLPQIPSQAPIVVSRRAILGLITEGTENFLRTDKTNLTITAQLPPFNKLTRRSYFVDVFSSTSKPVDWRATPSANWIHLDRTNGTGDTRLFVSIDWTNAPKEEDLRGSVLFATGTNQQIPVAVSAYNPTDTSSTDGADFVEDNFQIAMEAEHFSTVLPGKDARWETVTGLGYNGSAVAIFPMTTAIRSKQHPIAGETPCLKYELWVRHPGEWTATVRTLPTSSIEPGKLERYAIAVDDATPQIVSLPAPTSADDKQWQENVLRNAALTTSVHPIANPGRHTLKIWMVDPGIVLDTIFLTTSGAPGIGYTGPAETRIVK